MSAPFFEYSSTQDRQFRDGISKIVRARQRRLQQRERFGLPLDDAPLPYRPSTPIISTERDAASAGYQRTTLHEILRIAGASISDDMVNAEAFVTAMPTTAAEALDLLRNMTLMVPPNK